MRLTEKIKLRALDLGFVKVGITTADDFTEYADEVMNREHYQFLRFNGINSPSVAGAKPKNIVPEAKSIISLVYSFSHIDFPEELIDKVGRVYQARCYLPPADKTNGARLALFKAFLEENGVRPLSLPFPESLALPNRAIGARAGTVTYGKNTFAYAQGYGSFIILYSILVDTELEYDEPTVVRKCPEECTKCLDACPTGALYEPSKLNPYRCIAFNNWMGGRLNISDHIPEDIRDKIGGRIHGCDACQVACPRNDAPFKTGKFKDPLLEKIAANYDLEKILELNEEYYEAFLKPIMYNYISDYKYFKRNAAIAMGNSKAQKYLPALKRAMESSEDYLKEYAAWAIGKIGGKEAETILSESLARESGEAVIKEIKAALERSRL